MKEFRLGNKTAYRIAFFHWLITFFTDRLIFTYHLFDFSTTKAIAKTILAWGGKFAFLFILIGLYQFAAYLIVKVKQGNQYTKRFLFHTGIYFFVMLVFLLLTWPGIWRMDEFGMLDLARQVLPQFWQSYLTSIWYIFALMLVPIPAGIVLVEITITSCITGYIINKCEKYCKNKKWVWILYVPFLLFPVIDSNLYPLRMSLYAFLELFLAFLFINKAIECYEIQKQDMWVLAILASLVVSFRSEAIYYLFMAPVTFLLLYRKKSSIQIKIQFVCFFIGLSILLTGVQLIGNRLESGNNYDLTSTLLPLAPLLKEADDNHDKKQLKQIDQVVDVKVLLEGYRQGKTGISIYWSNPNLVRKNYTSVQYAEFKSGYYKLITKYPGVFLKERLVTFLESNQLLNKSEDIYRTQTNQRYISFREGYYLNTPISERARYTVITILECIPSKLGHAILYSSFLQAIATFVLLIYWIGKKRWEYALVLFNICAKIPLIFLTAPSRLFMYYYSIYLVGNVIIAGCVIHWLNHTIVRQKKRGKRI